MKKHKMEIAALTLLLGVLCYAFYDSNIKGSEQEVVLRDPVRKNNRYEIFFHDAGR